ncbi:hypothetical protein L7F22_059111 [Adiantum nelumboides]|nr:hypothetical protein [Adiantum nelumboides]MCO5604936.1 hypothetical protein [Adiantum nelumboides]
MEVSSLSAWDLVWALSVAALGGSMCKAWLSKGPFRGNPTNWPVLGMLPGLLLNLHHVYDWLASLLINNGGSFSFQGPWFSNMRYFITADPRNVEHALRTHFHNYPKGQDFSHIFNDLLGHGIFNADGHLWQMQRKITSLQVNSRACKQFSDSTVLEMVSNKLLPTMQHFCYRGLRFDLQDILLRFTFDTICLVSFGEDTGCLSPNLPVVPFSKAFEDALECTMLRFFLPPRWWKVLKWLRIGKERSMPKALMTVNEFCKKAISARKERLQHEIKSPYKKLDLTSCLLRTGGDTATIDEELLKDLALNFLLAGRDTSALALCWFFWLLANHPTVEEKVVAEIYCVIDSAKREGKPSLTRTELGQMHYLHAALTESLRLYPSVPLDIKHIVKDDVLPDGTHVKKDDKLIYGIHAMGRMESIWGSDCFLFCPERWLDPCNGKFTEAHMPPFHYLAFNAGPRTCIGKDMAYMLMKTVASTLLLHFRVVPVPGHKVVPKLSITLYMKYGLPVILEPRIGLGEQSQVKL